MPKERFYIPQELEINQQVKLEGPECHHLATVMRATAGDSIELINGLGVLCQAKIIDIQKKHVSLVVDTLQKIGRQPELIVIQALPKVNRLDYVIEKGTELGASAFWLFPGQRSEKKELSKNQFERLQHLAIAAMKQCGGLYLPEIKILPPLLKWTPTSFPLYFGSLDSSAPLLMNLLEKRNSLENAGFCVGPEGGLTDDEHAHLQLLGGMGVKLHPNILRTETAAIAGLVLLSHFLMKTHSSL